MKPGLRINEEMLEWICCPASRQRLRIVAPAELAQLNRWIASGGLATVGGEAVQEPLEQALIREDGQIAYAVVDGIARLIVDDGIPLPTATGSTNGEDQSSQITPDSIDSETP